MTGSSRGSILSAQRRRERDLVVATIVRGCQLQMNELALSQRRKFLTVPMPTKFWKGSAASVGFGLGA